MRSPINPSLLVIAALAIAVLAAAFWMWSDTGPERSEAANEQAKTEMHLEIDGTLGAGAVHCDSRTQSTCKLTKGSTFAVQIIPSAIPIGGYDIWVTFLEYGTLLYKPTDEPVDEVKFPDADPDFRKRSPARPSGKEGAVAHSAFTGFIIPLPNSFQKTTFVNLTFNCAENGQTPGQAHSSLMRLVSRNESPSGTVFDDDGVTSVPNVSGLTVECNPPPTATPTPTNTPTPTVTDTPTPTNTTTPVTCLTEPPATPFKQQAPCDTDQDGCSDQSENGALQFLGGQRNYLYHWDFFDVWTHPGDDPSGWERNRVINIFDIIATGARFGPGPVLSKADALAQALVPPTDGGGYHPAYDRGPVFGANNWDREPPDGSINVVDDMLGIAKQFGHNCDH